MNQTDFEILELTGEKPTSKKILHYWNNIKNNLLIKKDAALRADRKAVYDLMNKNQNIIHLFVTLQSTKKIEVIICGKGKPILLIAGLGTIAPIWFYQIEKLSQKYQVIIVHKPGHGFSEITSDLSYKGVSNTIYEVLYILNIVNPVNIIGACIGGLIAINFAASYPKRIDNLILVGAIYEWDTDVFDNEPLTRQKAKAITNYLDLFDKRLMNDFTLIMDEIIKGNSNLEDNSIKNQILSKSKSIDPYAYVKYVLDITKGETIHSLLPLIECETLLLTGKKDTVINIENSKTIHHIIKGSKYNEIIDAGHYPYITHSDEFNDIVLSFFQ